MITREKLKEIFGIPMAKARLEQCQGCIHFIRQTSKCDICECYMPIKVLIPLTSCPDNKW